ncbi:MAG: hypothetical protein RRX95_01065 [Oscillospiraceae bacterium]
MLIKKVIIPLMVAGVFCSLASGCSAKEYAWVVKIDDRQIPPGIYLVAQMCAYIEAEMSLDEKDEGITTDITGATIEGVSGEEWINNKTVENLKEYCYIDKEFANRGMEISEKEEEYIASVGASVWDTVGGAYGESGVEKQYYFDYLHYLYKNQRVFNDIYSLGGEKEVPSKVVKDYLKENLSRIQGFQIAKVNDDGTPPNENQLQELKTMAQEAVSEVSGGMDMAAAAGKYMSKAGALLGSTADFSNGEKFMLDSYLNKANGNVEEEFAKLVDSLKENECTVYDTNEYYLVFQKVPTYSSQGEYDSLRQTVVNLLKTDEFNAFVREQCRDMTVQVDERAVKHYSPSKMKISYS